MQTKAGSQKDGCRLWFLGLLFYKEEAQEENEDDYVVPVLLACKPIQCPIFVIFFPFVGQRKRRSTVFVTSFFLLYLGSKHVDSQLAAFYVTVATVFYEAFSSFCL